MSMLTAVAMSGGLDSSVVAWLLSQSGSSVVGLSMLLWDRSEENTHGRCCGALDLGDAKRVAQHCGIRHYTLRMDESFREHVVDPFIHDYLEGRTPSPCVRCNTWIKFDLFLERARQLGADRMATGHYARVVETPDGFELHTARDAGKDQSYFLFEMTQDQLASVDFPLGEMAKSDVRELARKARLSVAEKAESMEICFVSSGIQEFIEEQVVNNPDRFPSAPRAEASEIVDKDGNRLGRGDPYYRYTVGQRRGLGVSSNERLYVLGVEPEQNRVIVGTDEDLESKGLVGERLHWIGTTPEGVIEASVKIRSRHPGVRAQIRPKANHQVEVEFEVPQRGVAPGQAAVFYQGTRVLGGCWISSSLESAFQPQP